MAEWILSDEREEYDKKVQWCDLPSPALEMIYSFASREDQLNMSLVCRKWSEGFGTPSVWKTFRFAMTESQLSTETCPVMKFVRKYNSMFRHVEIHHFKTLNKHLIETWCKNFIEFLQILAGKAQLISVNFRDLPRCLWEIDSPTNDEMCRAIANFLQSQHHLKRAEFHNCYFTSNKGAELLTKLIENSRESLTHLVLRGFVRCNSMGKKEDSNLVINLPMLLCLPSFTTLESEYLPTFVIMFACQSAAIQTLKNRQTRGPRKIILNYDYDSMEIVEVGRLTSTDWRVMKQLFPDLKVEFNFTTDSPSLREAKFLIMPNMPITRLDYRYEHAFRFYLIPYRKVDVLFDQLLACKANDHLVSLHFGWSRFIPDLASIFIPFLQACEKLKCLELFIAYPAKGIDVLLESWLENRPKSLEKVLIVISGFEDEDDIMNLSTVYVNRLRLVMLSGFNMVLDVTRLHTISIPTREARTRLLIRRLLIRELAVSPGDLAEVVRSKSMGRNKAAPTSTNTPV